MSTGSAVAVARLDSAGLADQGVGVEMAMVEEAKEATATRAMVAVSTAGEVEAVRAKAKAEGKEVALASPKIGWRVRAQCRRRGRRFRLSRR